MGKNKIDLYVLMGLMAIAFFMLSCLMGACGMGNYHAYKEGVEFGLKVKPMVEERKDGKSRL